MESSSKTVLITGSSSGIGQAAALAFARAGWNVAATMRNPDPDVCGPLCDPNQDGYDRVRVIQLDVSDTDSIASAVQETIQAFGRIDVLINNAGYGAIGVFEKSSTKDVQRQFDVNVFGAMNVTRAVLPHLRKQKSGMIMNVSSMGGRLTFPLYSLYHATKWALEGWSESLQYELREFGIRVKLIEPGAIRTNFYTRSKYVFNEPLVGEPYEDYQEEVLEEMDEAGLRGSDPEVVARKLVRVASSSSGRLRVPVGGNAPLLLFLRWLLPQRVFAAMVRSVVE